jgi:hypothetical protein
MNKEVRILGVYLVDTLLGLALIDQVACVDRQPTNQPTNQSIKQTNN